MTHSGLNKIAESGSRMRLAGLVLFSVMICIVLADLSWSVPAYFLRYQDVHKEAEREIRNLVLAAVDPNIFPTLQYEGDIINRLSKMSAVVGGRIEDTAGEPLATVGEAPNLTMLEARRGKLTALESPDDRYLDIFIPTAESQLSHPIVLRINLRPTYLELRGLLIERALQTVFVTALGCLGIFFTLYPILFKPLALIRKTVLRGINDQDIANEFKIKWQRSDELGQLATAINKLLQAAANNYDEALHIAHEVSEKSAVATMAYLPSGKLSYANQSALDLFSADSLAELAARGQDFLKIKAAAAPSADPITIEGALVDGPFADEGTIITPTGPMPVICMGSITYREDGSVRRYVAQFLNAESAIQRISRLTVANERATERRITAEQRALALRTLLESSMIIMGSATPADSKQAVVEVESIIKVWAQTGARVGRTRRVLYNRLPALNGSPTMIPMLFRQALTYMDFRSAYRNTEFRVIGTNDSGLITFDITEHGMETAGEKLARDLSSEEECNLLLAAVMKLVEECGGSMRQTKDGELKLSIVLPRVIHAFSAVDKKGAAA